MLGLQYVAMMSYENAPMAFSKFGDCSSCNVENFPFFVLHIGQPHISHFSFDFGAFSDVQMKRHIMMDDVFT